MIRGKQLQECSTPTRTRTGGRRWQQGKWKGAARPARRREREGVCVGINRRILLFVGQQIRAAAVGDLREVAPSSQIGRALTRCFTVGSYHYIDDVVL